MKKTLIASLLASALPFAAQADFIGAKIGAGVWDHDPSGNIQSGAAGTAPSLTADLGLASEQEGYFYVAIEHPVPLLPNIKIQKTGLSSTGNGTTTASFGFGGQTYSGATTSSVQLDQTDYVLYWEILDNIVSLDIGINAKHVDGRVKVDDGVNPVDVAFDGYVPMAYAAVEFSFPGTGMSLAAELSALKLGDSEITDLTAKINYELATTLGLEFGVRTQDIKLSAMDSVNSSLKFEGFFAGLYLDF